MNTVKITLKKPIRTLNCRGKLITLEHPLVMGIINVTPDSFYSVNDRISPIDIYIKQADEMISEGAFCLDIGGQSTRPASERLDASAEGDRVIPIIREIRNAFPDVVISVDTYHHEVARAAIYAGADMVNDISAGDLDAEMISTVGKLGVPYVAMHMRGTPENMQERTDYQDLIKDVFDHFVRKIDVCQKAGIKDIILDPGIGFAKTIQQNFLILKQLNKLGLLDTPILVGLSRKSMIYKTLHATPAEALNGTTALHILALTNGADILRVHDVKEANEAIRLFDAYRSVVD